MSHTFISKAQLSNM